jgi:hypothetical protein
MVEKPVDKDTCDFQSIDSKEFFCPLFNFWLYRTPMKDGGSSVDKFVGKNHVAAIPRIRPTTTHLFLQEIQDSGRQKAGCLRNTCGDGIDHVIEAGVPT